MTNHPRYGRSPVEFNGRTISIRLSKPLADALRKLAMREQNPDSVVARRLLAAGLARELSEGSAEVA